MTSAAHLWQRLQARWPESAIEPSLARISAVMELLGDPQLSFPVIRVVGTNGKSSTSRMIESLLRAQGLRTGLFTSPHLVDARERIVFDGMPIDEERLLATWADIEPYVALVDERSIAEGGVALSFFEVMTALAFAAFADAPVDVAIVEAGLGGTWDSTSVAQGAVTVVTPIGIDHQDYLGETLGEIAADKAGAIAPGSLAVLARQQPAAAEALLRRVAEVEAEVAREGMEFGLLGRRLAVGGQEIDLRGLHGEYPGIFLPLFGEHQATNAALALAGAEAFLRGVGRLDEDLVREGFAAATSPGRLQVVRRSPTILVDAAHNPHGAQALAAAIGDSFDFTALIGVVGVLAGKDALGVLAALEPVLDRVVVTEPLSPRALPADVLALMAAEVFGEDRVEMAVTLADAIDRAVSLAEEAGADVGGYEGVGVLVTGSVVLAGDAVRLLA